MSPGWCRSFPSFTRRGVGYADGVMSTSFGDSPLSISGPPTSLAIKMQSEADSQGVRYSQPRAEPIIDGASHSSDYPCPSGSTDEPVQSSAQVVTNPEWCSVGSPSQR